MSKNIFATNTNESIKVNEFLRSACRRFVAGIDSCSIDMMSKLANDLSRDCKHGNIYNHLDEIAVLSTYSYFYNFDNSLIKRAANIMNNDMKSKFNIIVMTCLSMIEKSKYFDKIKNNAFMFKLNLIRSIEDKSSVYESVSSVDDAIDSMKKVSNIVKEKIAKEQSSTDDIIADNAQEIEIVDSNENTTQEETVTENQHEQVVEENVSEEETKDDAQDKTVEEVVEQSNEEETVEEVNDSPQEVITEVDSNSTPEFNQVRFMDQFSYNNLIQTVSSLGYEFIENGVEYVENMYLNRYICFDHSTNTQIYVLIDNNLIYKNGVNMIRITNNNDLFNCPWVPIENLEAMKLLLKTHINNKTTKKIKKLVGYPNGLKRVYRNVDFTQLQNAIDFDRWRELIETLNSNCSDDIFRFRKAMYENGDKLALVGGGTMNFVPQTMNSNNNKYIENVPQYVIAEF